CVSCFFFFFFFQAEDGIRDRNVTGVQTCALSISILCFFKTASTSGISSSSSSYKYVKDIGFASFNPLVSKELKPTNVPIALKATVEIIATMKNARALSFIRCDKSENNNIFVFFQNKARLDFNFRTTYTLICVNNK